MLNKHVYSIKLYWYSYCLNNPLIYTDPSGYLFSASGERARAESYLRRQGYSQVDIWMMESDPFMGSAFDSGGSGGSGGMGYGTSFYETFVRPTQQANFTSIKKHDGQYGYWVKETVDNNGYIVYPKGLKGGGIISEVTVCERFIPLISQSEFGNFSSTLSYVNTGFGVGSGIFAGNYGLTAAQTFRYAQRINGEIISAAEITAAHTVQSLKVANALGRINIVTDVIGTGYSAAKVYTDWEQGGWDNVNGWDVADAGVGAGGLVVSGLAIFGMVSNPVGWVVGIGAGIYFGVRLIQDLSK